jgi:hypothetical protein
MPNATPNLNFVAKAKDGSWCLYLPRGDGDSGKSAVQGNQESEQ